MNVNTFQYFTASKNKLDETKIYINDIRKILPDNLSEDAIRSIEFGCTEMLNNAIEHSEAEKISIVVADIESSLMFLIIDNGVGIFNKIQEKFNFETPRDSLLELMKGKLTTAPKSHSGMGIFLTSKLFEQFSIISEGIVYNDNSEINSVTHDYTKGKSGTSVIFSVNKNSTIKPKDVFDKYTNEDYEFVITELNLVHFAKETLLLSRSEARRLLRSLDKFKEVKLNFEGVEEIGYSFADEIFRVYYGTNPSVAIVPISANEYILKLINSRINER